jgi:nucleoside-diphosphate-sugar epimerase
MEEKKPKFTLVTVNPGLVFGPVAQPLGSLSEVNTSNQLFACIVRNEPIPPVEVPLWVDVRDVAQAHVQAMENETAAGERFLLIAGHYSNANIVEAVETNFPGYYSQIQGPDGNPPYPNVDASKCTRILGLKYTPLGQCVEDTMKTLQLSL